MVHDKKSRVHDISCLLEAPVCAGMIIPVTSSNSIKSLSSLKESVAFAEIDKELFEVLQDPVQRTVLEEALLENYFPETKANYYSSNYNLFDAIEQQIVSEDATVYRERIESLKESLQKEAFEEELFVRGGVFKREIPKIYKYQCAISGMRIESLSNAQMVDACHIVPFAISKDDTISNGVSLSPNLHRAFDRGLITITEDYIVRISPTITELDSPFSLKQFEGKQISLPQETHHFPSPQNLAWHRKETFRM
jgi:putative restriction endonuclease